MSAFFVLLLIASIFCFLIGIINPLAFKRWFGQGINRGRIALILGGLIVFSAIFTGVFASTSDNKPNSTPIEQSQTTSPKIEYSYDTKTETIPFEMTSVDDATLAKGQTQVKQEGKDGVKEIKYKITLTDGKETNREKVSENVTTQPVNKIVSNGTKVAETPSPSTSSGSGYTNVDGNYVKSPSDDPAGATARCNDGTYSYSQNHSGTCSHHGGVAEWLDQ